MNVAAYLRVSTEEQSQQNISIPAQQSRLLAYCQSREWTIYDFYKDEGYSGKDLNRPDISRLIQDAKQKKFDCVLVWKLDRLSRRQQHVMFLLEEIFVPNSIEFASVTENFDTSTPMGRAMLGFAAVFGQLERETIVERTIMGRDEAAKQGRFLGGPPPYGYSYNAAAKRLEINPIEAAVICFIYDEYTKGDRGFTYIAKLLQENNTPAPGGKSFWYSEAVHRILRHPTYAGYRQYKGELLKGNHEPIIPLEQWKTVQRNIDIKRLWTKPNSTWFGLLKGIMVCGECGAKIRFKSNGYYKGVPRLSYVCYSVDKSARHMVKDPNCPNHHFKAAKIEKLVIDTLMQYSLNPASLRRMVRNALNENGASNKIPATISYAKNELEDLKRRIRRWQDAFENEAIGMAELRERIQELKERRLFLESQLANYENQLLKENQVVSNIGNLTQTMSNLPRLWESADPEERRQLILGIVKRITLYKDGSILIEFLF